ncbi:hypothetical protein M408DRAFT_83001 [Serendipita vermifera MAFF 305830]|uniref:Cytochrome P450 n=1 Tax=Serendipita vermifera MAFF 305830 TaxID=933852 RepID=A0A0C3AKI6_SERVB|nr:hypothetical protein M408DRAFT_83001 [Serendipita vermifera MAFF 305830]
MSHIVQIVFFYLPGNTIYTKALVLGFFGYASFASIGIVKIVLRPYFSPLRTFKGPGGGTFLRGHFPQIRNAEEAGLWHREQTNKYGHVWVHKAIFNQDRLVTTDPKALHYVMSNSMAYHKAEETRFFLGQLLGDAPYHGMEQPSKQRENLTRLQNPAFGNIHIREMTGIFLRDTLEEQISRTQDQSESTVVDMVSYLSFVDMVSYLSCTTLDIIGLAGFDYSFDSLSHLANNDRNGSELASAFNKLLASAKFSTLTILKVVFPVLRMITFDERSRTVNQNKAVISRIGKQLIEEKRRALQSSNEDGRAKDLLTLLIKANLADANEGGDRQLSDEEMVNQIPTFLIAGHETTSTATSWGLYSLAMHPDVQQKLREELLGLPTEQPTMEDLNSLAYLDMVIREILRVHSVIAATARVASHEDIIPLDTPFTDKYGKVHDGIHVKKGDTIVIPVKVVNTLESIWGPDALEFNPDRWLNPPKATQGIPGVWGNQLTFLGGPRACIGFRFAIVEMKALLFSLIRSFEFELAVSPDQVIQRASLVTRPVLRSEPEKGFQLPMRIRRVRT